MNDPAAKALIARSGNRVPRIAPIAIAMASGHDHPGGGAQPGPPRCLGAGEGDRGKHRLVAELRQEEGRAHREDGPAAGALRPCAIVVVEPVAPNRPRGKDQERDAGHDLDGGGG